MRASTERGGAPRDRAAEGHYWQKQLGCRSGIIAWTHRSRFERGVSLAGSHPTATLLDYGCGDGTFLNFAAGHFAASVGADIAPDQIEDCRRRLAGIPGISFCEIRDLEGPEHTGAFKVVTCMETLEHCPEPALAKVLNDLNRLCAPDGTIIISVPIETGPTFLLKYIVRTLAAWRGISQYSYYERYSPGVAVRMLFATSRTVIERPQYGDPASPNHSHYGFNWRSLRARIADELEIEKTEFSPWGWSGGWLSSQGWFVCRPRR